MRKACGYVKKRRLNLNLNPEAERHRHCIGYDRENICRDCDDGRAHSGGPEAPPAWVCAPTSYPYFALATSRYTHDDARPHLYTWRSKPLFNT